MALLFQSEIDRADWWIGQLNERLPGLDIRVWPETGTLTDIEYALVWRPASGMLATLPNLKAIFSLGAGVDHLFADPHLPGDVPITRVVDGQLTAGIVEYGLGHILAIHRRFAEYARLQQAGEWRMLGQRGAGETRVGILGLGVMGTALAEALAGLGFPVAGWARRERPAGAIAGTRTYSGPDGLAELLAASHIVVCLLPLTAETEGLLDADRFAQMRPGAWLINIARGAHVVDRDLIAALDEGRLAGAILDVFDVEPLPADHPYWSHDKIVVTPHVAAITDPRGTADQVAENIRRSERGEKLLNLVDPAQGY